MFDRILVAVDGSDCALRGARVGLELAAATGAAVDAVYVTTQNGADEHASVVLDDVADLAADADPTVELHALEGDPADVIVSHAAGRGADLIVLGRQGRDGIGERLLGSVAHSVLRQSDLPVLTVPESGNGFDVERVLVTTDGSDAAEWAAPYVAAIAAQHGADLHVCTVVDIEREAGPFSAGGVTEEVIERYEQRGEEAVSRFADLLPDAEPGLSVQTAVVRDRPHAGIESYVDEHDIDLVIMSSVGESSIVGQLLGSVTDRVLRIVDVPVLVVTSEPDTE
ncbi:MAG: universal stress protein [Haloarculaceae archaeon]